MLILRRIHLFLWKLCRICRLLVLRRIDLFLRKLCRICRLLRILRRIYRLLIFFTAPLSLLRIIFVIW